MGKYFDGVLAFMFRQLFYKIPANPKIDLREKTFLITGANTGVGLACATQLVSCGARVVLAVRSVAKGHSARIEIIKQHPGATIEVRECDLASFQSVLGLVDGLSKDSFSFDGVILNAAVLCRSWVRSPEGFEMSLQVNVLSNALLALSLLPLLRGNSPTENIGNPRLVMVSSEAHAITSLKERSEGNLLEAFNDPARFNAATCYFSSKLLNLLWTLSLSRKVDPRKLSVVLVSPGFCRSELFREIDRWWATDAISWCFARTAQAGARMLMFASVVAPEQEAHGSYYSQGMKTATSEYSTSVAGLECQEKVWDEVLSVLRQVKPDIDRMSNL